MSISGVVGVSWPWKVFPTFIEGSDVMDQAITDIIFTALGERKMNLSFGSEVMKLVFENKGILLQSLAKREISIALKQHLPVVKVLNIDVEESEKDTDPVTITVTYEYKGAISSTSISAPAL